VPRPLLERGEGLGWLTNAVFGIRAESDRLGDLQAKMAACLRNGARLVVLIEVYRPGARARVFRDAKTVTFEPELPGFALDLGPSTRREPTASPQ